MSFVNTGGPLLRYLLKIMVMFDFVKIHQPYFNLHFWIF